MGQLVDGRWTMGQVANTNAEGGFDRPQSQLRNWVTADGNAGPTGEGGFEAEPDRYHLYVSLACPWAHRALVFRKLKKLEDVIGVSIVHYHMGDEGWAFRQADGATGDPLMDKHYLYEVYTEADPRYTGKVTVPVLWDKKRKTIVNNESADIIRMLNSAFDAYGDGDLDLYPERLRNEIDAVNELVYDNINNGVYKTGFAKSQGKYEQAYDALFGALDEIEERLSGQRYLCGSTMTEADWRLFTTLVRFDPVYQFHFKCNRNALSDMPNLWNYLLDLYQKPGIAMTVDLDHIKGHYYTSHPDVNPTRIVPKGPDVDYSASHDRNRFDR